MRSLALEFWVVLFGWLRWLSPLYLVRRVVPRARTSPYLFVDSWVMAHLFLSAALLAASYKEGFQPWEAVLAGYGGLRIMEILVQQINGLLFDEYRAAKRGERYVVGYRRALILVINSYIEVMFWFALFYRNAASAFKPESIILDNYVESFQLSFRTMTTWGYTPFTPNEPIGYTLVFLQSVVGLLMLLMVLVGFLALIARRRADTQPRPAQLQSARQQQPQARPMRPVQQAPSTVVTQESPEPPQQQPPQPPQGPQDAQQANPAPPEDGQQPDDDGEKPPERADG